MKIRFLSLLACLLASPASAHHPLNGFPMESFSHGLLSGVGHPMLGFDHLFFVVLVGVMAFLTQRRLLAPAAYIVAMLVGCGLVSAGYALPLTALMVGSSLLIAGVLVLTGKSPTLRPALFLFALFGLFHGAAFGGSIAAQETGVGGSVMIGYLLGLGVIQYLIAILSGALIVSAKGASNRAALTPRLAGAMVAGAGLLLTLEQIEGPVLQVIAG